MLVKIISVLIVDKQNILRYDVAYPIAIWCALQDVNLKYSVLDTMKEVST